MPAASRDHTPIELCHAVANRITAVCDLPYLGKAGQEIDSLDDKLSADLVQNPAKFSHEVYAMYLRGAGDLIYGVGLVADRSDLHFSAACLARSVCEYSSLAWRLADPQLSGEERIGWAISASRADMNHPGHAGQYGPEGAEIIKATEVWVKRQEFRVRKGLEKYGVLQEMMFPRMGDEQYRVLSGRAHPKFTDMTMSVVGMQNGSPEMRFTTWCDVLLAVSRALYAIKHVETVRGGHVNHLDGLIQAHAHYARTAGLGGIALDGITSTQEP